MTHRLPALSCEFKWRRPVGGAAEHWVIQGGLPLRGVRDTDKFGLRMLPLRPIWLGLLTNTGVYALAWAPLLAAPAWVRRVQRRARGRCTGSGYSRAGLALEAACPECGGPGPALGPCGPVSR